MAGRLARSRGRRAETGVMGMLEVSGRTAAVTTAIERGLLPPPGQ